MKARAEAFYSGCCPYSYFFAYDGKFLDETWTRTGGDFKAELERLGVGVVEYKCSNIQNWLGNSTYK